MSLVTGNTAIDALVYSSWKAAPDTAVTLSYSFLGDVLPSDMSEDAYGYRPMSERQKIAVRDALATWSAVANITFTELSAGQRGDIEFGTNNQANSGSAAYAYLPDRISSVALFLNNQAGSSVKQDLGTYGFAVLIHEIGHTLGLKHPGDYNATGAATAGPFLPKEMDNRDYTQMSYTPSTAQGLARIEPITPMLLDIQAVQHLYGANLTYRTGDDVYKFGDTALPRCIWDAGGSDTLDFSGCTDPTLIDLRAGGFSSTFLQIHNISIAYGVVIEHAVGTPYNDVIYGNGAGGSIDAGGGADTIYGALGPERINGGDGVDTLVLAGTRRDYAISREGAAVTVTANAGGADALAAVERLRFDDGTVALDIDGVAGQMYRLYQAAFNRTPDLAGLGYWIGAGDRGTPLATVSEAFVTSKEFTDTYGPLSDAQFIAQLYVNILHRAPDQAGLDFHVNHLLAGHTTRATALMAFSESPENQAALVGLISGGIDYTPA